MADILIPAQGMARAEFEFNLAAARIARTQISPNPPATAVDEADLSQAAVSLIDSKNHFEANAKAFGVADSMTRTQLDLIG